MHTSLFCMVCPSVPRGELRGSPLEKALPPMPALGTEMMLLSLHRHQLNPDSAPGGKSIDPPQGNVLGSKQASKASTCFLSKAVGHDGQTGSQEEADTIFPKPPFMILSSGDNGPLTLMAHAFS